MQSALYAFMTLVSTLFRQVLFITEKEKVINLALVIAGIVLAAIAVLQNWFASTLIALYAVYLLLLILLPYMIFRAAVLAILTWFDVLFTKFPQLKVDSPNSMEAARARVLRIFVEKNIPTYSLGSAAFFSLGIERSFLAFINKYVGIMFPYVLFSKSPLVVIRFSPIKAAKPGAAQSRVAIAFEDEMRARTLARTLESSVKYL